MHYSDIRASIKRRNLNGLCRGGGTFALKILFLKSTSILDKERESEGCLMSTIQTFYLYFIRLADHIVAHCCELEHIAR